MKKFVVFFAILIFTALAAWFYIQRFYGKITVPKPVVEVPQSSQSQAEVTEEKCALKESLEYYYYDGNDPDWKNNNKFGIYIYSENESFFELAQNLVNSSGGDWGYVLIPFNIKDRDYTKWNNAFEMMRNKHLIPVIQLYTLDHSNYKKHTISAAKFLNSFLWPIKYRYVSVYNEPNDAKFWGDTVNPGEYAELLDYTIDVFKEENSNYFMLNGALNVSTPTNQSNMDAFTFLFRMNNEIPGIFNKLDGWASHPYPQPNFSGSPSDNGRWSIKAYKNELDYLKASLGLEKDLKVFITETGWAHAEGEVYDNNFLPLTTVSEYYKDAFVEVWLKDDQVRAVMPFSIWYEPPFDHFSWVNRDRVPYAHFDTIKKLKKIKGTPPVIKSAEFKLSGC